MIGPDGGLRLSDGRGRIDVACAASSRNPPQPKEPDSAIHDARSCLRHHRQTRTPYFAKSATRPPHSAARMRNCGWNASHASASRVDPGRRARIIEQRAADGDEPRVRAKLPRIPAVRPEDPAVLMRRESDLLCAGGLPCAPPCRTPSDSLEGNDGASNKLARLSRSVAVPAAQVPEKQAPLTTVR
jgi:hypothetical protein